MLCMYIGEVILAVDQHAAHERIRVEILDKKYIDNNGQVLSTTLSTPLQISVSNQIRQFLSEPRTLQLLSKHGK